MRLGHLAPLAGIMAPGRGIPLVLGVVFRGKEVKAFGGMVRRRFGL